MGGRGSSSKLFISSLIKNVVYKQSVNSLRGYENWKYTGETHPSPSGETIYAMENVDTGGVQWFSETEIRTFKTAFTKQQIEKVKKINKWLKK